MGLASSAIDYSIRSIIRPYLEKAHLNEEGVLKLRHLAERSLSLLRPPRATLVTRRYSGVEFEEICPVDGYIRGDLLYFPGGGYICCSPATHRNLTLRLANQIGLRVWSVNYSKVPDVKLSVIQQQARSFYAQMQRQSQAFQRPMFIGGDSAGGHLAISTLLSSARLNLPMPKGLICLSPWTDMSCPREGRYHQDWDPLIPTSKLHDVAQMCLAGANPLDPVFSPVYGDLTCLPPTLVQAVKTEVLYHDATRFVARARESGVKARLSVWTQVPHCFQLLAPYLAQAVDAIDEISYFVNSLLVTERSLLLAS